MTDESDLDALPDDVVHMGRFLEASSDWPESARFGRAMALLHFGTFRVDRFPFEETFENELAAATALTRSFTQLRAAWVIASHGFLEGVP
ncbi:hypothetical protein OG350_24885 [Streptomyces achromogenes]|uniref:Uncharacterized protein n=1 Tax=Streptomyces achromogenes TaxID=67255 RepID=A0ABZ1KWU0_STRAH